MCHLEPAALVTPARLMLFPGSNVLIWEVLFSSVVAITIVLL
jgi:hypothetical protein